MSLMQILVIQFMKELNYSLLFTPTGAMISVTERLPTEHFRTSSGFLLKYVRHCSTTVAQRVVRKV